MSLFSKYGFSKHTIPYNGNMHTIKFDCQNSSLAMSLEQFTNRNGMRDIETTLDLYLQDLYRSITMLKPIYTLAKANEKKD